MLFTDWVTLPTPVFSTCSGRNSINEIVVTNLIGKKKRFKYPFRYSSTPPRRNFILYFLLHTLRQVAHVVSMISNLIYFPSK